MIVIRKCVPKPSSDSKSVGRGLFLEADVTVAMDEDGLKELRACTLNGRGFHLQMGQPPKRDVEKEKKEVDFLRSKSASFWGYRQQKERELEIMRARLSESERRYQLLRREFIILEERRSPLISTSLQPLQGPQSPKDYQDSIMDRLKEYAMGGIPTVLPSLGIRLDGNTDPVRDLMRGNYAVEYQAEFVPSKREEPAPAKKAPERFGSIEFDEDE